MRQNILGILGLLIIVGGMYQYWGNNNFLALIALFFGGALVYKALRNKQK